MGGLNANGQGERNKGTESAAKSVLVGLEQATDGGVVMCWKEYQKRRREKHRKTR